MLCEYVVWKCTSSSASSATRPVALHQRGFQLESQVSPTESVFQLIGTDVSNHPHPVFVDVSSQDRESTVVIPRSHQCQELVSQTLHCIFPVKPDHLSISRRLWVNDEDLGSQFSNEAALPHRLSGAFPTSIHV